MCTHSRIQQPNKNEAIVVPGAVSVNVANVLEPAQSDPVTVELNESNTFVSIAPDHAELLREMAAQEGRYIPNKWKRVHEEFKKLYPNADLCKDALRSRLKDKSKPRSRAKKASAHTSDHNGTPDEDASASMLPVSTTKRKHESACDNCRHNKKKCGDATTNIHCKYKKTSSTTKSITSYFAV